MRRALSRRFLHKHASLYCPFPRFFPQTLLPYKSLLRKRGVSHYYSSGIDNLWFRHRHYSVVLGYSLEMFKKKGFCVVTGASKGLGREISLQLAEEWSKEGVESDLIITARSAEQLEETKQLINSRTRGVSVSVVAGDAGDMTYFPSLCSQLLTGLDPTQHEVGVLINNAGTHDDFGVPFISLEPKNILGNVNINLTSMVILTTQFLAAFPSSTQCYVVNISSLLATVFIPGFPLYSTTKAARSAFMGVLGVELPNVRQLNYSPGPCDTDMYHSIPEEIRKKFRNVLPPKESVQKLMKLLNEDKYKNSSVIDYFDDESA